MGTQIYPFTCLLPPTLPSSFEGEFGNVRYTVKVTLDRPWKFDQETKTAFTVLSPVDLNLNSRLKVMVVVMLSFTPITYVVICRSLCESHWRSIFAVAGANPDL